MRKFLKDIEIKKVTLRANYKSDDTEKKFKCIFCPLLTSLYKKEIRRSFNTKESLRRHYEQHFNHGLHSHQCAMKLPDGTRNWSQFFTKFLT